MDNISVKDLYKLFFGKKLVVVDKLGTGNPTIIPPTNSIPTKPIPTTILPSTKTVDKSVQLTPISKSIYKSTSPRSKPYVLEQMLKDNDDIDKLDSKTDITDPDYQEKMENNGLGFFMEDFICANCFCPVCNKRTLCKYAHSNVPVIDIVCTNYKYHLDNNKCFLFQVKTSVTNSYFDLLSRTISVGSKKYGYNAHVCYGTNNMTDKFVVPGYICIKLGKFDPIGQTYMIDHQNSFVLVPDYNNNQNQSYYQYLKNTGIYGKSVISWNNTMVNAVPFNTISHIGKVVHDIYSEKEIDNPYNFLISVTNAPPNSVTNAPPNSVAKRIDF